LTNGRENASLSGREIINNIHIFAATVMACASLAAQAQSAGEPAPPTHWKFGVQVGTVHDDSKTEPVVQLSFGYDFDSTWSVEALTSVNALFMRDGASTDTHYQFDHALGARVLATLPLGGKWSAVGGLGLATVHEELGLNDHGPSRDRTSALVSAALMYRSGRHWSMGVEASTFAQSHTLNLGLRGEVHF
jgi:hypothetical protein